MRIKQVVLASAFAMAIGAVSPATAATVTATGYTFDQDADCGTYCYFDAGHATLAGSGESRRAAYGELTDGVLGVAGWEVGFAAPWVGWTDSTVNIDFTFAGTQNFTTVSVGTTQDNIADVVLPDLKVFSSLDGLSWTQQGVLATAPSSANDHGTFETGPHVFLTLSNMNFDAPFVRLQVSNHGAGYGTFSFLDEVRFSNDGASAVPEPATWAMMLIGFFGAGSLLRRRTVGAVRA